MFYKSYNFRSFLGNRNVITFSFCKLLFCPPFVRIYPFEEYI